MIRASCGDLQPSPKSNDRANAVEPNLVLRVLDRHRLRRVDHSSLGSIVPCQAGSWPNTCRRSDRDETPTIALLLHVRHNHVGRVVDRFDVDREDLVEVLIRDLVGRLNKSHKQIVSNDDPKISKVLYPISTQDRSGHHTLFL